MKYDNIENYKCLTRTRNRELYPNNPRIHNEYTCSTIAVDDYLVGMYDFFLTEGFCEGITKKYDDGRLVMKCYVIEFCITVEENLIPPTSEGYRFLVRMSDLFNSSFINRQQRNETEFYKYIVSALYKAIPNNLREGDMIPLPNVVRVATQESIIHDTTIGEYDIYYMTHIVVSHISQY